MSRGGRGGRFQGGRPRGPNLPFDVDPELLEAVDKFEDEDRSSEDDFSKELFPDLTSSIMSAPITDAERRGVQLERRLQAKRRAGPFWTGTNEQWAEIQSRTGAEANAFDSVATYGKKRGRKPFQLPSLKKVKMCYPELLPKELKDVVTDSTANAAARKRKLGLAKKSAVDRLARIDDDDETNADAHDRTVSEGEEGNEDDDDGLEREPQDDEFDDEEEEGDNDYNAEKYFDDGEEDLDEGDAEEYGDDG